jgi:hypothetical protein
MTGTLTPPTLDELASANALFMERIASLEEGLRRIDQLDVGVWPSWEMGRIARDLLGSDYRAKRAEELNQFVQENGG